MKTLVLVACALIISLDLVAGTSAPLYKDKRAPIEERIEDLLKRMTLEEKVLQMTQSTYGKNANENNVEKSKKAVRPEIGSLIYRSTNPAYRNQIMKKAMEESRLGIPILMGFDVIHGYKTVYPIPLAQACSWNRELVGQACAVAAREARLSGVDWTFSPMIDVARDARWGRVAEGYGEDPYANAEFCVASVNGYQGKDLAEQTSIAACLKHYVGYSMSEGGRDYHSSDVSMQTLWETFLPPYEAGIKAGAATVMSGFNDLSGVPASANPYTLTEVLKKRWKHDGFVVSDWGSIENQIAQGFARDKKEAALHAVMAGVEMDMVDNNYLDALPQLVAEHAVPMKTIDEAVRRILRVKFRLGLFDHPYVAEVSEQERYFAPHSLEVAERLAEESMVLLKNSNNTLPLSKQVKHIALIGPMVDDRIDLMGSWEGQGAAETVQTLLEGMQEEFKGRAALHVAKGCDFDGADESGFDEALRAAMASDVIVACIGEKKNWSGENASRSSIALPAIQQKLIGVLKKTGKPLVLVFSSGRPVDFGSIEANSDAIVAIWQPGIRGGAAMAGILSGRVNPSGKLAITFPLTTGQIPTYYNMRQSARPRLGVYQDIPNEPRYWFGHGLSYTTYAYGRVRLSAATIGKHQRLTASVDVENTGSMDGKETVLWYISDPVASITRPMKELKYFEKKEVKAGTKTTFTFEIDPMRDLSFPDSDGSRRLEAGEFSISLNGQTATFELTE